MSSQIKTYFIFILFISNFGFSQSLNDIKKDSIVNIGQTDLSLIYYKKTTAVWHNIANFYVVEPTKNWFIKLQSVNLLVEVDVKHKLFYAITQDELTGGYKRFLLGKEIFNADIFSCRGGCFLRSQLLKIDNEFYDLSLDKTKNNTGGFKGKIGLEFKRKNLIITDYLINHNNYSPILSSQYPDEDSIVNSNPIYQINDYDYTTMQSGVYNFNKNKWIIPRQYITINYQKKEIITNSDSTNLRIKASQVWRRKNCKWKTQSKKYAQIKNIGDLYICRTTLNSSKESSYIILNKSLIPITFNDFYNFDEIILINKNLKITPITNGNIKPFYINTKGEILNQ